MPFPPFGCRSSLSGVFVFRPLPVCVADKRFVARKTLPNRLRTPRHVVLQSGEESESFSCQRCMYEFKGNLYCTLCSLPPPSFFFNTSGWSARDVCQSGFGRLCVFFFLRRSSFVGCFSLECRRADRLFLARLDLN